MEMETTKPKEEILASTGGDQVELTSSLDIYELNTYDMVKARFEKTCFKVNNPFCYVRVAEDGTGPQKHTHRSIQQFYCDLTYCRKKGGQWYPFIPTWLKDPTKRTVETIEFKTKTERPQKRVKKSE